MNCKYCGKFFEGNSIGGHALWCDSRPISEINELKHKISSAGCGRKHSEETKAKISRIRKQYIKDNPDKVPYKLNHSHKESYPEKYFSKCLPNFAHPYLIPETAYEGDFVNPDKKIIIEIDGEQHYCDPRIVEHDIKRTRILEELGWKIHRIRWSHYVKLSNEEKKEIVDNLNLDEINDFDVTNYIKKQHKCKCGKILSDKRHSNCIKCSNAVKNYNRRKFDATKEELEVLIKEKPMTEIGKMFGVSDNAVKKRCKKLGIELKDMRGYWMKVNARIV